jgi:hypothetical protein
MAESYVSRDIALGLLKHGVAIDANARPFAWWIQKMLMLVTRARAYATPTYLLAGAYRIRAGSTASGSSSS